MKRMNWCILFGVIAIGYSVYFPGLSGGFIFDDFHSLKMLSVLGNDISIDNLIRYFGLSDTGPLKRPLSVFSFLIDAQNWPADPWSFKHTNVIIHLINGLLLWLLLFRITSKHPQHKPFAFTLSLLAMAFWFLHPFWVSTTLYIVQRMAMLPMTFVLLGLNLYLTARESQQSHLNAKLFFSVWVIGGLATLSKENGVLYYFYILVFEYLIVQNYIGKSGLFKRAQNLWLWTPAIILVLGLMVVTPSLIERYDVREFDLYQRTISQFRAIAYYLYHLFVPKYFTEGIFTDGFLVSESLFQPISTFWSACLVIVLITMTWVFRKKFPILSFSFAFFFLAHLLESTIFPLELYFEHRNYLSAAFLFWPFTLMLMVSKISDHVKISIGVMILLFLSLFTYLRSNIWSNNLMLHEMTMKKFPESLRARVLTADIYDRTGFKEYAKDILIRSQRSHPRHEIFLNLAMIKCDLGIFKEEDYEDINLKLESVKMTATDLAAFTGYLKKIMFDQCQLGSPNKKAQAVLKRLERNAFRNHQYGSESINYYWALFHIESTKDYNKALDYLDKTTTSNQSIDYMISSIETLYDYGALEQAKELLKRTSVLYKKKYKYRIDWKNHKDLINQLEELLNKRNIYE